MRNSSAFEFKPYSKKQLQALSWWMPQSPYYDSPMIICAGSVRSGKTIALIDSFITWSLYTFGNKGYNFILAGKSIGALERNVIGPMRDILTAKGIPHEYRRGESCLSFGGNYYYCFGANNEASQDTLQGLTCAGALLDEVALFPESFVNQVIARCSIESSRIFACCNPMGPKHYIKTEFIDKAAEKHLCHLHFTMDDNLTLSEEVKANYKRMYSGVFYLRNILGQWTLAEGLIYPNFNLSHCISIEQIPPLQKLYISCDFGMNNPLVYLKIGTAIINGVTHFYVIDEFYHDGSKQPKTVGQYSKDLVNFIGNQQIQSIIIDPSATPLKNQLLSDRIGNVRNANNEVLPGIANVSQMLNEGRIHVVASKCPNLIKEFGEYSWDPKAQMRGEDAPLKVSDHCLDSLRYFIQTMYPTRQGLLFA